MNEINVTPVTDDHHTEKRTWQPPTMDVFDVTTLTAGGPPNIIYNPADATGYQS
ncbi:MAG TPA: hypothetical protein VEK11_19410 [Thermoanaerobaculia bacterium]|nr:hypothetical protein [Thermoanaerobaculia bacterium]